MSSAPSTLIRNLEGRIRSWSPAAEKHYGWRKEQAVGKVSHSLLETIFPEPLDEINNKLQECGYWEGELIHKLKDGRFVRVKSTWELQPDQYDQPTVFEFNREPKEFSPKLVCFATEKNRRRGEQVKDDVPPKFSQLRIGAMMVQRKPAWWLLPAMIVISAYGSLLYFFKAPTGRLLE